MRQINKELKTILDELEELGIEERIQTINQIRLELAKRSPFKNEPVDCVLWVKSDEVVANDYNPNSVAPPEMTLLEHSIKEDGYTQPIVSWKNRNHFEVVDGFHRNRIGRESEDIKERLNGYLPIVVINDQRTERNNRIAATIRHNRARGKHKIDSMSDIVLELKNRNWTTQRICRELGMDEDEVLRLCQISGLEDIFKDEDFSRSWNVEDSIVDEDFEGFTDDVSIEEKQLHLFRTVNTSDQNRVFHTFDKWECWKSGFYSPTPPEGKTGEECKKEFAELLLDTEKFKFYLEKVTTEWQNSCEHYLTNIAMNRIAWLGQAAVCCATGISHKYRDGFHLLSNEQQQIANETALHYLNQWLKKRNMDEVTLDEATSKGRQSEIY